MSFLGDIVQRAKELKAASGWKIDNIDLYGNANFRTLEFVFWCRKALRELIRENKPYALPYGETYLSAQCMAAIMRIAAKPEVFSYYEQKVENAFMFAKYMGIVKGWGVIRWGIDPWG